jgi:hypothetical protein
MKTYLTLPKPPPIRRMFLKESANGELPLMASFPGCGLLNAMADVVLMVLDG